MLGHQQRPHGMASPPTDAAGGPKTVVLELSNTDEDDRPTLTDELVGNISPLVVRSERSAEELQDDERNMPTGPGQAWSAPATQNDVPLAEQRRPQAALNELPPGTGPLYKCAICQEFVYESQLDHHVLICPDPAEAVAQVDQATLPGALEVHDGEVVEETLDHRASKSRGADAHPLMTDCSGGSSTGMPLDSGGTPDTTRNMWKKWKDSELAQHHDAQLQRASLRRNDLVKELRRKEEEECTFQPKTLPRGSPRTCSRLDTTGQGQWKERWEQRARMQRLKQVEAQAYAELTLRPKISRFAQTWSQRQQEMLGETGPLSVFERLYQVAQQQQDSRHESQQEDIMDNGKGDVAASLASSSPQRSGASRRVPTSELLYSDALDRRERLKAMAEQLQARRDEEARVNRQVLGRSRRYYWQMLERQIKAAFEATTLGDPVLREGLLEEFLVRFGCTKCSKAIPPNLADDETSKLRVALWRHLDPKKMGYTDLLTLTVFFHVLMGAVDDAARASQGLVRDAAASGIVEERGARTNGFASSESAPQLSAISEEAFAQRQTGSSIPASPLRVAEDDEGRRILELLLRFDPLKLRSEFQQIYLHRMHYQAMQDKKDHQTEKGQGSEVVPPKIDAHSQAMAAKVLERQRGLCGKQVQSHAEILLWRHSQVEAKKEEKRAKAKLDEVSGCTFKPKSYTQRTHENHVEITTPHGSTRTEVLYARGLAEKEKREAKALEDAQARIHAEVEGCTFRPKIVKSVKSYHRSHEGVAQAPVPRGFYETRQRLRAANEANKAKLHQKEDRMARVVPVGSAGAVGSTSVLNVSVNPDLSRRDASGSNDRVGLAPVAEDLGPRVRPAAAKAATPRPRSANASSTGPASARARPRSRDGQVPMRSQSQPIRASSAETLPMSSREAYGMGLGLKPERSADETLSREPHSQDQLDPYSPSSATCGPGFGAVETNRESAAEAEATLPPPLLYVDVNIAPGQPPERIVLREGQSVNEVAADFAAKHVLTPVLAQRLHQLLREVLTQRVPPV